MVERGLMSSLYIHSFRSLGLFRSIFKYYNLKLLNLAKNLKTVNYYKSVFLCPDLTEAQKINFKQLITEIIHLKQAQQGKRNLLWNPWG